jgi:hypothetical protein
MRRHEDDRTDSGINRFVTTQRRLDRKARIAVGLVVALLLAGPVLALWNFVSSSQSSELVADGHSADDRLIGLKNGATLFLKHGPMSQKVSHWLQLNTNDRTAFEVADSNFVTGSTEPTKDGLSSVQQVAQIMNADQQVRAQIVVATDPSDSDGLLQLERSRAIRLGRELASERVPAQRISSAEKPLSDLEARHVIDHPGQDSRLFIIVSR